MSKLIEPTREGDTLQAVSRILRNEKSGCAVNVPFDFQLPERPSDLPQGWLPPLMGIFDDDVLVVMDQTMEYECCYSAMYSRLGWYQKPVPVSSVVVQRQKAKLPQDGFLTAASFWETC
ncbi:MAG: hypothetical protein KA314_04800 [Chloroflexi bacterium]|nr:hypothetical protein [Chloroflexota bacterium]